MALKQSFTKTDNFGIEVDLKDCYVKVITVSATKEEAQMSVNVFEEANGRSYFSENYKFQINLNGDNPIKQGYMHLKTLPEFSDAVDC